MNNKFIVIGALLFLAFVGGLIYLAKMDATTPSLSEGKFVSYAESLDLDIDQFKLDIASEEITARVNEDLLSAQSAGANSTPTFLVNGVQTRVPNSVGEMKALFDSFLENAEVQAIPEGAHTKGSKTPKVIVTEFSDIQCPACGAYAPTLKEFFETYPDNEIALIYKHFPLKSIHTHAEAAAKATEAAALQGKFWEMHDLLFESQNEWGR